MKKSYRFPLFFSLFLTAALLCSCGGEPSQTQQTAQDAQNIAADPAEGAQGGAAESADGTQGAQSSAAGSADNAQGDAAGSTDGTQGAADSADNAQGDAAGSADGTQGAAGSADNAQDAAGSADGAQGGKSAPASSQESIGAVSFTPNEKSYSMVYGSSTLHAYFQRKDVVPGSGKMRIYKKSDRSLIEEIDLTDPQKCIEGEQDSTFSLLGWDGGSHLIVYLAKVPSPGEAYYVTLEEGAFVSKDGTARSKAVEDDATWRYAVAAYGVAPSRPSGSSVYVGDVFNADILVKAPAAYAKIESYDENRVRFNQKEFQEDGKLEIRIYQLGEDAFTVTFYNENDDPIGAVRLSYYASMPPTPEEEAPRRAITEL